ncbi:hypothetical protein PM027_03050 [[Clostridium] symbiosum]|uniref:Uncharacterized protein n=2 Tax=Lachnospiraceae TaxID=186803 RepID=A0A2X2UEL8_9FIRM|nr:MULTISPECIES: hypothetical protein [Lachnospiraceae]MCA5576586.1 hypothetical protein [Enterocloster clostridioformis]MDB2017035.1 hypothetical protein [[Clostridium] symbiosum]SQB14884.1 Uncharacterised protein [Enterocloster clostridioformis]
MEMINKEERKAVVKRLYSLAYWFTNEMFNDEEKGARNKARFEKECKEKPGEVIMMVDCSENNARVMKSCLKETRDAINFLKNAEYDVELWQLAGINAMLDQCNTENIIPFDLPSAIKGLLCMHIICEEQPEE